jgi:hypothetical protein
MFTSKIHITEDQRQRILQEARTSPKTHSHYGFETAKDSLGKDLSGLRNHLSNTFFTNAIAHFSIDNERFTTQSCDGRVISVNPGHGLSPDTPIKRWYQCVAFLDVGDLGCKLELRREDMRMHTTPRGIEMPMRIFKPNILDVYYWPAYIPWGLTVNNSERDTVLFTNTFTFVKATPQTTIRPI